MTILIRTKLSPFVVFLAAFLLARPAAAQTTQPDHPRIVNVYNFVRNSDFRIKDSQDVLFDCTKNQVALFKHYELPATWALQYDALINPRYQKLFKEELGSKDEIAGWWEIPRPLAEKAGLKWRGRWDWDSASNVGFSPGYTPDERRKLVDVYMADFKAIFGNFPKTVGSWYIDEVTLAYMADKYGIVASCNCKDQIGTDGYTLWGGYWNQAYYPSKLNAYMPAQDKAGQIDIPIFRMLGSDPIYQFGAPRGMFTLEPVYPRAGGSADWVNWFMDSQINQPCMAFSFTQAGQENSFGWDAMKKGITLQAELLSKQSKAGQIQIKTLADSGLWFRKQFAVTPATSVVAMDDWRHQDRKTVWFDSRFYRMNLIWQDGGFFIRDLHRFDQNVVSPTHDKVLEKTALAYGTLPIADSAVWSNKTTKAGAFPVFVSDTGDESRMVPDVAPDVKSMNDSSQLGIAQPLRGGGLLKIICTENQLQCECLDAGRNPARWAWDLVGGDGQKAVVQSVTPTTIAYRSEGFGYQLTPAADGGSFEQRSDGTIRIKSGKDGKITLNLGSN